MMFVILVSRYITLYLLLILSLLFEWTFIAILSTSICLDLLYFTICLCVLLCYSIFSIPFYLVLFLNWYSLLCFSLFHCALLCFLLYFFHSASLQPSILFCSCWGSLDLFALYTLYFTLLCSIFTPLYSRLLCIALFLYITSLRFTSFRTIALCFPYFSWSSFRSDFNFTSS